MIKNIYIFDYLNDIKEIYNFIMENTSSKLSKNVFYIPEDSKNKITKKGLIFKIKRKMYILKYIGFFNVLKNLFFKNSIILTESSFSFNSKLISNEIIFLNHGWGTKKSPGNNEINNKRSMKFYKNIVRYSSYIICLSNFDKTYFLNDFSLNKYPKPYFLPFGLSRNDFLIKNKNKKFFRRKIVDIFSINENCKIILYAPTHRENEVFNKDFLNKILSEFDFLDDKLEKKGIKILFRPHYFVSNLEKRIKKYKNIFYAGFDIYKDVRPFLLGCDSLITDYSSIFIDYLLLKKPIIFYIPDIEEYKKLRGLAIDFENSIHTPGPKIKKLSELLSLKEADFNLFNLEKSMEFFHEYMDGKSIERIGNFLIKRMKSEKEI